MCVQLRRHVAFHGTGSIMLKLRRDKLRRCLWWVIAADSRLRVVLELLQRCANAFPMCIPHPVIAPDQSSERHGFGRRKCRVPSGTVLHRFDHFSVTALVLVGSALPNQLLARFWMLALAEPR